MRLRRLLLRLGAEVARGGRRLAAVLVIIVVIVDSILGKVRNAKLPLAIIVRNECGAVGLVRSLQFSAQMKGRMRGVVVDRERTEKNERNGETKSEIYRMALKRQRPDTCTTSKP